MANCYLVKWGNDFSDSENEGATIAFLDYGLVSYENPLASSGLMLKSWEMTMNYLDQRKSPSLPLLEPGKSYQIEILAEIFPEDSLQLAVEFYDEEGKLLDVTYLETMSGSFFYPSEASRYKVVLNNKNNESLLFQYLKIIEGEREIILEMDEISHLVVLRAADDKPRQAEFVIMKPAQITQALALPETGKVRIYNFAGVASEFEEDMAGLYRQLIKLDIEKLWVLKGRLYATLDEDRIQRLTEDKKD
jgi:accessory Sec system protein Asp3